MMGIAQSVLATILRIRRPAIMNGCTRKERKHACRITALLASAGMTGVVAQKRCTGAVDPVEFACHPHSRLVAMQNAGANQRLSDRFDHGLEASRTLLGGTLQGSL